MLKFNKNEPIFYYHTFPVSTNHFTTFVSTFDIDSRNDKQKESRNEYRRINVINNSIQVINNFWDCV